MFRDPDQKRANVRFAQHLRGLATPLHKTTHPAEIGPLRPWGESPQSHGLFHRIAVLAHPFLLVISTSRGRWLWQERRYDNSTAKRFSSTLSMRTRITEYLGSG